MSRKYARYERCPSPGCSNYAPKGKLCNQCQNKARRNKKALGPYFEPVSAEFLPNPGGEVPIIKLTLEQIQELQAEVARDYWRHPNPDKEKK